MAYGMPSRHVRGVSKGLAMINDMVQQAFIDNAPSDIRDEIAMWFDVRNETLNRCYSIDGYEEMEADAQRAIYDSIRRELGQC